MRVTASTSVVLPLPVAPMYGQRLPLRYAEKLTSFSVGALLWG